MADHPTIPMPLTGATRQRLLDLHRVLLRLHKILLDFERVEYEKVNGAIGSANRVLSLVMSDPWFDWLHRISELIVAIDELTEDEAASQAGAFELLETARDLFRPSGGASGEAGSTGEDTPFLKRYKAALQKEPGAVLAHVEVQRVLAEDAQ